MEDIKTTQALEQLIRDTRKSQGLTQVHLDLLAIAYNLKRCSRLSIG